LKRYKGTVNHIRGGDTYTVYVRNTETNEIVEEAVITARDTDVAVVQAREIAEEWEKKIITRWSYSRLGTYESCPKKAYYRYIEQLPEKQHPAAKRGTRIHSLAEDYITGKIETMPRELKLFSEAFEKLREDWLAKKVFVEQDWAFDINWNTAPWRGDITWGRYKIDAFFKEGDYGKVIDFKTGKYWSNETGYRDQCSLYACGVFSRFPDLQNVEAELWYLDHQKISRHAFSREEIQEAQDDFTSRAYAMTHDIKFIATPSENACRWCSFKQTCPDYYEN
jgi:RecB family exonuclease